GEKQSVTLTAIPSARNARHARRPASISGTLITMLSAIFASSRPSRSIACVSVATTSALIGPSTTRQISARISRGSPPEPAAFARSEGFVVTPSIRPASAARRISVRSALSRKSFILGLLDLTLIVCIRDPHEEEPLGRRRRRRLEPGLTGEQPVQILQRATPPPYVHHRPDQVPHHVVQEPVRRDVERDADPVPLPPCGAVDRAAVAALLLARLRERRERVLAHDPGRGRIEQIDVQRFGERP